MIEHSMRKPSKVYCCISPHSHLHVLYVAGAEKDFEQVYIFLLDHKNGNARLIILVKSDRYCN